MSHFERKTYFAEIIVPLPVPGTFTYRVPYELNNAVQIGQRVVVQFGKKKIVAGLIASIHEKIPSHFTPKYILGLLDVEAVVNEKQLKLWSWIAQYYMCHLGEVMQAALPSALKLSSESVIVLSESFIPDVQHLNESEFLIVEALQLQSKLTITEVSKVVGYQKVMPLLKSMIEQKMIVMEEELKEKFKAKTERYVKLQNSFKSEESLRQLMDQLSKKAYKQLELLLAYLAYPGSLEKNEEVAAAQLLRRSGTNNSQLSALVEKGVFKVFDKTVSRLDTFSQEIHPDNIVLTDHQQSALNSIQQQFSEKDCVLLHGVTSSGKTEIYIKLIQDCIARGEQVLYLLPEIALTTQIINRIRKYFGSKTGVYHSRYNQNEKVEIWQKVLKGNPLSQNDHQIVIGPRSALFLPFCNLGLIIVDEEHDNSFKQFDPAPRYNARDAAIVLAGIHQSKVLLGSATPAYESYFNAKAGKYGFAELTERYGGVQMPKIEIVSLREETRRKTMQSHFSSILMQRIGNALSEKEQVILFQNRRGFSLRLECDQCNWVPECRQCDVSLIYHKNQNLLRCHYCGFAIEVPHECPECHSTALRMHGFGTEKVEEELKLLLPKARIARLDLDTTRAKFAYQQILESFEDHQTDILTGTQMVTKGLDFERVSIVGVLNADNLLSYPDFRSHERSFQLMAQVSGRAGRKSKQGVVIIQTYQPGHPILQDVLHNRYQELFEKQMSIRQQYHYPPYYRLILIRLKHRDQHSLNLAAADLAKILRSYFGKDLLGPEFPMVSRIKSLYIKQILIKFDRRSSTSETKKQIQAGLDRFQQLSSAKSLIIQIDVDPQ